MDHLTGPILTGRFFTGRIFTGRIIRNRAVRQDGFTVLELLVTTVILAIVFAAIWQTFTNTTNEINVSVAETGLDTALRKVVNRIAEDLVDSGNDGTEDKVVSHPRSSTTTGEAITFSRRIGLAGTEDDWSAEITYRRDSSPGEIPGNGVDDDGDGMVDEAFLVRVENGQTARIADNVLELDFDRQAGEDQISLTITIAQDLGPRFPPLTRTLTTILGLRNR